MKTLTFPILFLLFIAISNAFWGSTVGITVFMANFYNIDQSSVQANMVNNIFFIFYLVATPFTHFFHLNGNMIVFFISTIIGLCIRIKFYIPEYSDVAMGTNMSNSTGIIGSGSWQNLLSGQFEGINAIIVANMFLAFSQPFISNNILPVSTEYISKNYQGLFIGTTSMSSSFGYAAGYLISIYSIQSSEEYFDRFQDINICYLIVLLGLLGFYSAQIFCERKQNQKKNSSSELSSSSIPISESESKSIESNIDNIKQIIHHSRSDNLNLDKLKNVTEDLKSSSLKIAPVNTISISIVEVQNKNQFQSGPKNNNGNSNTHSKSEPQHIGKVKESRSKSKSKSQSKSKSNCWKKYSKHILLTFTYALIYSVFNLATNYLELILLWKNFDSNTILIASFLNLVPGIPFPVIFGYFMDADDKKTEYLSRCILVCQIVSLSCFLYLENEIAIFIVLFILGATGSSLSSMFLTLLTYANQAQREHQRQRQRQYQIDGQNQNPSQTETEIETEDESEKEDKNLIKSESYWNNILLSSSTLLTVIFLLLPLSNSTSSNMFLGATIIQIICFMIFLYFQRI